MYNPLAEDEHEYSKAVDMLVPLGLTVGEIRELIHASLVKAGLISESITPSKLRLRIFESEKKYPKEILHANRKWADYESDWKKIVKVAAQVIDEDTPIAKDIIVVVIRGYDPLTKTLGPKKEFLLSKNMLCNDLRKLIVKEFGVVVDQQMKEVTPKPEGETPKPEGEIMEEHMGEHMEEQKVEKEEKVETEDQTYQFISITRAWNAEIGKISLYSTDV